MSDLKRKKLEESLAFVESLSDLLAEGEEERSAFRRNFSCSTKRKGSYALILKMLHGSSGGTKGDVS